MRRGRWAAASWNTSLHSKNLRVDIRKCYNDFNIY